MTLSADAFRVKGRPGTRCSVGLVLDALPAKDRAVLQAALDAPLAEVQHARIEAVLRDDGIRLPQLTIGKHRRKVCCCDT